MRPHKYIRVPEHRALNNSCSTVQNKVYLIYNYDNKVDSAVRALGFFLFLLIKNTLYEVETYRQLEVAELQLLLNLSLEFSDRSDSELDHEISLPLSSLELLPSSVDSASPLIAAILSTAGASYSKNHPAESMKLLNTCAILALLQSAVHRDTEAL